MTDHLAFLLSNLQIGGAQRVVVNLANEFRNRNYEVDIVLVEELGPLAQELENGISVVNLGCDRALTSIPSLIYYLQKTNPDLLFSSLTYLNDVSLIASRLCLSDHKLLISEHNTRIDSDELNSEMKIAKLLYPRADYKVAVSEGVAQNVVQWSGLPRSAIDVVYNPIVTPSLKKKAQEIPDHPWFSDRTEPIIISAGRHVEQKDFTTLLKSFSILRDNSGAKLILLGEGPRTDHLKTLSEDLGISSDVDMPGFVSNLYSYLSSSDLFILSSRWEGFGNVIVEAMACGTPVVATDCPSGPSEILQGGQYGTLVDVGDPDQMASAIEESLRKSWSREKIKERADVFSAKNIVDHYEDLISDAK